MINFYALAVHSLTHKNACMFHCAQDETDEQYLRKVADVMHTLFGTHGSTLLPFFDQLLPTFAGMLVSDDVMMM